MSDDSSSTFTQQQAMEFFQKMWNPLGANFPGMPQMPTPGVTGAETMSNAFANLNPFAAFAQPNANPFATFDPTEVAKRISEFKAVESWLSLQVGVLQMTIKTLEMQKSSLDALHAQAAANATDKK